MSDRPSFGLWLKQRRKSLDLTQEQLADQVGCAASTIRKIEAGVLRPSRQIAERLADQLELPVEERAAFLKAARMPLQPRERAAQADENGASGSIMPAPAGVPARIPWRFARFWAVIGGAGVLLALIGVLASDAFRGISAPAASPPAPTVAGAPIDQGQPTTMAPVAVATIAPASPRGQGDSLRILIPHPIELLNPYLSPNFWDYAAMRLSLEPLATIAPDGNLRPVLAAAVPTVGNGGITKDFKSVTWKLKPGVLWSDGSPFTADDVVFTYTYCAALKDACVPWTRATLERVENVEALDQTTVRINWKQPTPYPYVLFVNSNEVLEKRQFSACLGKPATTDPACLRANLAPIGTGPYQLREITSDGRAIYDLNQHYREPDKPFFKEVRLQPVEDSVKTARMVFETGEADFVPYLNWINATAVTTLTQLIALGKADWQAVPTSYVEQLVLNRANPDPALGDKRAEPDQPHPFLSDLRVRQALALAIDRTAITQLMYRLGMPSKPSCELVVTEPYVTQTASAGGRHSCEPDVERARKLLDEVGWRVGTDGVRQKNGVRMHVLYQTSDHPVRQQVQVLIKAAWEQLGVEVELKSIAADEYFDGVAGQPAALSQFYADVEQYANGYDTELTFYFCGWTTDHIAQKSNGWHGDNVMRFSSAEYDLLCARLRAEPDLEKRKEIVLKMNDVLVEDVVVIPIGTGGGQLAAAYSRRLKGLDIGPWDVSTWNIADWTMDS
jgi:peptide/nickel transport system substrate-binding protein